MDREAIVEQLEAVLREKLVQHYGQSTQITDLAQLSAGASRETWSFDALCADGARIPLILKRDPAGARVSNELGVDRTTEGKLIQLAAQSGIPAPEVPFFLQAEARTTEGFVMHRLAGESLARRILRDEKYSDARPHLAFQCGQALAQIHGLPEAQLPPLKSQNVTETLVEYRQALQGFGHPQPGFQYGIRWLSKHAKSAGRRHTLVHGDFRNGNIMVDAEGLRGVLDWELAQLGNPVGDLGWICIRAWRYGHDDKPVGGFGEVADLLAGYEAGGGGVVSPETLHYWQVFGTLRWGMLCLHMGFAHLDGRDRSMEKAAIGRRAAETEYDLLQLVD